MTNAIAAALAFALALASIGLQGDAQRASPPPRQPTFRTGVEVVEVAVTVRDGDGRFVSDLTGRDFRISEQGAPQQIVAFEHVAIPLRAGPPAVELSAASTDVASNVRAGEARVFVLVLDSLHIAPARVGALRRYARQFIEQHVGPGDFAAVLSPGALPSATQDFTNRKALLVAAIDHFSGTKLVSATIQREQEKQRAIQSGVSVHGGRDPEDAERAYRAASLNDVLEAVARDLDSMRGRRKTVLLFTEGFDYNLFDPLATVQRYGGDIRRALEQSVGALMRTNTVLYAVDPRALNSTDDDRLASPMYGQPASTNDLVNPGLEGEYAASIASLRSLSEPTGGFAVVNTTDFRSAFDRIVTESSEYYVLGYTPSRPPKPGEFREISVQVSRPDVRVLARKGYVLPAAQVRVRQQPDPFVDVPSGAPSLGRRTPPRGSLVLPAEPQGAPAVPRGVAPELAALLSTALPRAGLPLRVQAVAFRGDAKKASVQVVVEVLGRGLQFVERSGRFEEHIDLALVTVDNRGHVGNGKSTAIDLRLTREELQRVAGTGVRWVTKLELAPGTYQVRVAAGARSVTPGAVTCDVEVPRFEDEHFAMTRVNLTSVASLLMITRGDGKLMKTLGTPPTLERSFVKGDVITAGVEVYLPASAPAGVLVRARLERPGGLPPVDAGSTSLGGRGRVRTEEIAFPLNTAALDPGPHVLRITVSGGSERLERTIAFDVAPAPVTGK